MGAMLAAVVSARALRLPDGAAFSSYCCSSVACTGPSVTLPMWPNAVALRTRSSLVGLSVQVVLSVPLILTHSTSPMMTKVALLDCRVCMQDLPLRKVIIVSQAGLPAAACHVPCTGLALRRMPPTATPSPASTQWVGSQASARQPIAQPMMFAMVAPPAMEPFPQVQLHP